MLVTAETLLICGFKKEIADLVGPALTEPCQRFEINDARRIGAFIGQCSIESANFTTMEEGLRYRSVERITTVFKRLRSHPQSVLQTLVNNPEKLANYAYANINGNGGIETGDGWNFRGSGWKQITGRGNFRAAELALGRPYTKEPDLIRKAPDSALTAAHYWHSNKCNVLAASGMHDSLTRVINGSGMLQKEERAAASNKFIRLLGG